MITEPLHVEWIPGRVGGVAGERLMVILAAPGCEWARTTGGCTNCSFPQSFGVNRPVSVDEYAAQVSALRSRIEGRSSGPLQVELFVSGSYFNPDEVPPEAQRLILEQVARLPGVAHILVEARPEHLTEARVAEAVDAAAGVPLEVGIGLESADREIRLKRIKKGFSWRQFEEAAQLLARTGLGLFVYVLLKPLDTGESEAIDDAVRTAERVFALGVALELPTRVGLEPCFVGPGTPLEAAFEAGRYRPPRLWSVVEVVRRIAPLGPVKVGLSDEGLEPQRAAHNCGRCDATVREALGAFNVSGDPAALDALDCACRGEWRTVVG